MICVGVIADTHGLLRPEVLRAFEGVDLIVHAGDVGNRAVLDGLSNIARVEAVYGNVDDRHDPSLTQARMITLGSIMIHVSHGHEFGSPTPPLVLARYSGDVVVFGHTHRAVVERDASGRLAVNPGAAGPRRFNLQPSVGKLTIANGVATVAIIPLE